MIWLLIVVLLMILVLAAVFSPWRWPALERAGGGDEELRHAATEVRDLEAARDAKYREIRDAELDRETGKLSSKDFTSVDGGLRAEAVEILQQLDRAQSRLLKRQRATGSEDPVDTSWTHAAMTEPASGALKRPDAATPELE